MADTNFASMRWTNKLHFNAELQNRVIELDSRMDPADELNGVSPKQLLLAATGGCMGMDIASLLPKMRVPFTSLSLDVTGELTEEHPRIYHTITVVITVGAEEQYREKIESAIQKSKDKYCGVSAMLSRASTMHFELNLV